MPAIHSDRSGDHRLRFVFSDTVLSFSRAINLTLGDIAETLGELPLQRYGHPVSIALTMGRDRPRRSVSRAISLLAAAAIVAVLAGPAFAQGAPQTLALTRLDPQTLATGLRTSKVVGSPVFNEANETVGTIDDLIVTPNDQVPFAVLSVGGFLGVGAKFVVVPYGALEVDDKRMLLRGATKDSLKALPNFKYSQ